MPGKKKTSDSKKAQYKAYQVEDRASINRLRKVERHLKKHPNDAQANSTEPVNYKKRGV